MCLDVKLCEYKISLRMQQMYKVYGICYIRKVKQYKRLFKSDMTYRNYVESDYLSCFLDLDTLVLQY